jgi:hypothetical protein
MVETRSAGKRGRARRGALFGTLATGLPRIDR